MNELIKKGRYYAFLAMYVIQLLCYIKGKNVSIQSLSNVVYPSQLKLLRV